MTATTVDKVIRIRTDISQPLADAKRLQAAFSSIGGVNPALAQMVNNLTGASGATQRLGSAMAAANNNVAGLSGRLGGLGQAAQAAMSRLGGMTGSLGGIATAGLGLGLTAAAGGLIALGTAAVNASAQFQAYRASLTTVLGDSDKASQAFDRLTQFAQKTPFSLDQSVQGFIKLKALGLTPSEAAMTSYGNTASAMGKSLDQMVEAVADAATGEFERLKEFGIKAKQHGDQVSFTFQGVTKTVGNNSADIQKYLLAIGNTQFAGAMEKQMQTFGGAMSNLEDTVNQTFAKIGDAGLTASIAKVLNMLSNGLTSMSPVLVALGKLMGSVVDAVVSAGSGIGNMFAGLLSNGGKGLTFVETLTIAMNALSYGVQGLGQIMGAVFSAMGQIIGGVIGTVRATFTGLWEWLSGSSSVATNSVSLNFIGVLRAIKYLAANIQNIFSTALSAVGGAFGVLGSRIASFLSGNWNAFQGMGSALQSQFTGIGKLIGDTSKEMGKLATDSKGAAAAWERLKGNTGKKGGATLDELAGPAPKPEPKAAKDDKDAAKKAADRLKRENEFWQALKDQATAAGMLSYQAEAYNKQAELRKILTRDLNDVEKSRVATAISEIETTKTITGLRQQAFEAGNQYTVELGRQVGLTEAQKGIEDALFKARVDALNRGVDISSAAYKLAEADLKKQLDKNAALAQQNELLKRGQDFRLSMSDGARAGDDRKKLDDGLKAYLDGVASGKISGAFKDQVLAGYDAARLKIEQDAIKVLLEMSPSLGRQARIDVLNSDAKKATAQLDSLVLSPAARKQAEADIQTTLSNALGKVAAETTREWVDQFDDLADYFGGRLGDVLRTFGDGFDRIAKMMSGELTGPAGFLAKVLNRQGTYSDTAKGFGVEGIGKALGNPLKSLSEGFGDFKSMFSGDLATGLVKGFTKLQAGSQVGGMVAGVGDLLGLGKGFSTGASIGGTIGGLFGPVGSIIGSLGGGLIGSLFSSATHGKAILTGAGPAEISGNKAGVRTELTGAAGSIQDGLSKLAVELGGTVGAFNVSIGKYKDSFRVSSTGASNVDTKKTNRISGLIYDGKDEAEAIAIAIKDAIKDGAITGIAPIISNALKSLGADSAVQFAKDWTAAMNDYKAMIDPIGSAVEAIIKPLSALRETMVKVGASTEDLTKIDDYRTLKLKEALKQQLSSLTDFLAQLRGDGSGISKLDQLNTKMKEFDALSARVKAGDSSVDQKAFTSLGQSIFGLAGDVYGTATSQFQDIRSMLIGTSQAFSDNITKAFNTAAGYDAANSTTSIDNTTAAIQAQAADAKAYYANQAASNAMQESYLKQIAANSNAAAAPASSTGAPAYNGRYLGSTY